ncbi:MAG TPA: glutamine-hydrolyzing GMP synthase, partial [Burkholderiaceae bacterium]|nr:glutamine-hydrolyzing GMP synthase [Burkholderiaceae bacterium]
MSTQNHETVIILDFGSQYTQLIARRVREAGVYCEILPFNTPLTAIKARHPVGIILSGGPSSVDEDGAPHCDRAVLDIGVPTLGVCYGMQLMTHMLGGTLGRSAHREFGHALVKRDTAYSSRMLKGMPEEMRVWASHGDFVAAAPPGFAVAATSNNAPVAVMEAPDRGYYAMLFHPEVAHTDRGKELLRNFAFDVCGCTGDWTIASFIDESIGRIRAQVGEGRVACALSGGVDSTVAATLIHRAVGDRLQCIFVDNGLLRLNEAQQVVERYKKLKLPVHHVDASATFL